MDWAVFPLAKDGRTVDQLLVVHARTPELTAVSESLTGRLG
jgi:hypothetical protein